MSEELRRTRAQHFFNVLRTADTSDAVYGLDIENEAEELAGPSPDWLDRRYVIIQTMLCGSGDDQKERVEDPLIEFATDLELAQVFVESWIFDEQDKHGPDYVAEAAVYDLDTGKEITFSVRREIEWNEAPLAADNTPQPQEGL